MPNTTIVVTAFIKLLLVQEQYKELILKYMRTSYSSIETYLQCPQKYKFQEIDHIRVPKSKEAIFGTLIHDTLKFMFKRDPLFPTLDEVVGYFREHWPSQEVLGQESKHDPLKHSWDKEEEKIYFEEGVKMLKKFYEKQAPWNFTVVDLESHFEIAVSDETTGETHILAGKIDRIDKLPEGTYEIIDYKTSKRMPSQADIDRNRQLSLYSLGLQRRWPHLNPEDIKLSLYFLKHSEKLSTRLTRETTEKTVVSLLETIREIQDHMRSGKEFEPVPGPLCDWCGYKPMCPAWKHLYKKNPNFQTSISKDEIENVVKEFFELKKTGQQNEKRLAELQGQIREYMTAEGLTRVFGDDGVISKKTVQRYEYDFEKIKAILSPLGKWEDVLSADDKKLKKIMKEVPQETRGAIEVCRVVTKEYSVLTASTIKNKNLG